MFDLNYITDIDCANNLSLCNCLNASNVQNYMPLYKRFFKLTETNFNNIHLNNDSNVVSLNTRESYNIFNADIKNCDGNTNSSPVFIKFAPITDPIRFMMGKCDNENVLKLPTFIMDEDINVQIVKENNSAYIDSFFSFLLSKINKTHNFVHGLNHYGTFLANLKEYKVNIYDELEILMDSNYFNDNVNKLFTIDDYNEYCTIDGSRKNRQEIKIHNDVELSDVQDISCDIDVIKNNDKSKSVSENSNKTSESGSSRTSSCSSRSSLTDESICGESDEEYSSDNSSEYSDDDIIVNANITNYPVSMIILEKCKTTLDEYMVNSELSETEWECILIQIIIQLLVYQKMFDFTHNDLHTNNIMYVDTPKEYLNYCINDVYYKVPTFGKIWKIIDFGRAIFKFKSNIFCSGSFHPNGDAAGQYNCKPFLNVNKPRLEPNTSFDLSRLGCSLFDFFFEDIENTKNKELSDLEQLIVKWCEDDNKRNILYKSNGKERYPEFKLYKMIARTVHHCVPEEQLKLPIFQKFVVPRKKINKKQIIMNIDLLPKYY